MQAFKEEESKGRKNPYDEGEISSGLNPFLLDYLKITQSKAFRRLAYKTQVLCSPENPHIRTRSVHTQEVIAISTFISENLGLNTYLCQAIAAGHDIGHVPYGHLGERVLSEISGKPFNHPIFGVIVAQQVERKGDGLNLSYETLEGMLNHSRGKKELTTDNSKPQEYSVVMFADKIAYTFSDINDTIRYGYLQESEILPYIQELGANQRRRTDSCIEALVNESKKKDVVSFSEGKAFDKFDRLKAFMYENVYEKMNFKLQEIILKEAYSFFASLKETEGVDPAIVVSLLTDMEMNEFAGYLIKTRKPSFESINHFSVFEILPYLKNKDIDYSNPRLDWADNL